MELSKLVQGFLEADGWEVRSGGRDLLIGSRQSFGGESQHVCVWAPATEPERGLGAREGAYQARFKDVSDRYPGAQKFVIVESLEGLSREFVQGARKWFDVRVLVPAQFIDTAFKWEESHEASSAIKNLRRAGEQRLRSRVRQPFTVKGDGDGPDLLEELERRFASGDVTPVTIVSGPAGMGKSYLFEALFSRLYDTFLRAKQAQRLSPRPLPLLPQHLARAEASTIKSILHGYLDSEFARPLDLRLFEWRLTHGTATWLLDGLDEVIARDPSFFDYLIDLLTRPEGSPPSILICVRDSLLSANEDLRLFCEEADEYVTIFRLAEWDAECRRRYAEIRFGREAARFIAAVEGNRTMESLASTPYYGALLADMYEADSLTDVSSETELLGRAVGAIIEREYEKGLLDRRVVSQSVVQEFIEVIAAEDFLNGFRGVPASDARELAEAILPDLSRDETDALVAQMTQVALFGSGSDGELRFAQELVEQYLLAEYLVGLVSRPEVLIRRLASREIPSDWITLRVMSDEVRQRGLASSAPQALFSAGRHEAAFRALLQVAALVVPHPRALRDVPFERRDLTGIRFESLDLTGCSFRAANLTDCVFSKCVLNDVDFEEAILSNTAFDDLSAGSLRGARFGDLVGLYSIIVDGRVLGRHADVRSWLEKGTGASAATLEPCNAALQLRHIFQKFVRPSGMGRRDWLGWKGVLAGRRHDDPELAARVAVQHGYLIREGVRDRVRRPGGELLREIVTFVRSMQLSPGLRALLDEVCQVEGCEHVPAAVES